MVRNFNNSENYHKNSCINVSDDMYILFSNVVKFVSFSRVRSKGKKGKPKSKTKRNNFTVGIFECLAPM